MSLHLYNTYSKKKEEFKPAENNKVKIYSCGPTVYSHPHIGNFRSFIVADILGRYLRYSGYEVIHIMNITDVGHLTTDDNLAPDEEGADKIQLAAMSEKKTPIEITQFYTDKFFYLLKILNLYPASFYPKATDHIPEMIEITRKLLEKGYGYAVGGTIYYDINKFPKYGSLSGNTLENLRAGSRVSVRSEKRSPFDFALWKQDPKHLMQWDSPWGKGFPGWHLECSAMSMKYLGDTIDIHTGGEDNIFPHHECEIAQSDAFSGKQVVRYWLHTKHLLVNNQKMSKSLGNFYTVEDILNMGYHPMVLRYALMSTHYKQQMNFTLEALKSAQGAVERLRDFKKMIDDRIVSGQDSGQMGRSVLQYAPTLLKTREAFTESLDDDLNISSALSVVFDFVSETYKSDINKTDALNIQKALNDFDKVLGILETDTAPIFIGEEEIARLIKERERSRENKDFRRADEIRNYLIEKGIILEDTPQGTRWKRAL
ncbi:MAG: cysteine--tRNA ligase [Planctomycetota bacterium]|nr:cysteine--tRNA ligase [Planctomycetota bacterium]